jgi:F0F1-type ATP synthase membrane subunit c/vacuolar-type H+-ATPase subunit K
MVYFAGALVAGSGLLSVAFASGFVSATGAGFDSDSPLELELLTRDRLEDA